MKKIFGAIAVLGLAIASTGTQSQPASAQVIINNVLSPFTTLQVAPGYRVYGSGYWSPEQHARCHYRWDPYYGEWRTHCARMNYGHERRVQYGYERRGQYGYERRGQYEYERRGQYGYQSGYDERRGEYWDYRD